jgi:hypothetical protein
MTDNLNPDHAKEVTVETNTLRRAFRLNTELVAEYLAKLSDPDAVLTFTTRIGRNTEVHIPVRQITYLSVGDLDPSEIY